MEINETTSVVLINCPTCGHPVAESLLIPAGEQSICPNCKDEYLQRMKEGVALNADDSFVEMRELHLKHEASLQSVAILYYLGAILTGFAGVMILFSGFASMGGSASLVGVGVFYILLTVGLIAVARGFRKLKSWVRIPGTIFAVLGLFAFPVGTLINGYILYLMYSAKGKAVLSAEYQEVIAATPDIKYRTSPAMIFLALVIIVLVVFGIVVSVA